MSTRPRRLVLVLLGVLLPVLSASPAGASSWTTTLNALSAGRAQSVPTPSAPTGVTATCTSSTTKTVTVSWAAVAHATYAVYQSNTTVTGTYTVVASSVSATSWTSGGLSDGKTYWYQVRASIGSTWVSANSASTTGRLISKNAPNCS
jgi:hypothetical protein